MTEPLIVPASSPVTADDVRAAVAKARHDAMVSAAEAGPWAQRFGAALREGLADFPEIHVDAGAAGDIELLAPASAALLEYVEPYLVRLHVCGQGEGSTAVFNDTVSERDALSVIAMWALQQQEP